MDWIRRLINHHTPSKEEQIAKLERMVAEKEKIVKLKQAEARLRARLKELRQEEREVSRISIAKTAIWAGMGLILMIGFIKIAGC